MRIFLPPELQAHEARIKRFFDAMVYKLRVNAHKPGLDGADVNHCLTRIGEETEELSRAIEEGNALEIMLEAADVANFALIAAVAAIENPEGPAPAGAVAPMPRPILPPSRHGNPREYVRVKPITQAGASPPAQDPFPGRRA